MEASDAKLGLAGPRPNPCRCRQLESLQCAICRAQSVLLLQQKCSTIMIAHMMTGFCVNMTCNSCEPTSISQTWRMLYLGRYLSP